MKLLKIKLSDDLKEPFRSLQPGFVIDFKPDLNAKDLEPVCLAGLNGSGKSNLFELISEIFYYLDCQQLTFGANSLKEPRDFGFEIEYALPIFLGSPFYKLDSGIAFGDRYIIVKISKPVGEKPFYHTLPLKFYYKLKEEEKEGGKATVNWEEVSDNVSFLLPKKIFAYTSGLNELLSNSYYKMQFNYFSEYLKQSKDTERFYIENSRLFFIDYQANTAIFIANFLLGDAYGIQEIRKATNVKSIHSFRITIKKTDPSGKLIRFNQDLEMRIDRLKRCATTFYENDSNSNKVLTLDYLVQEATKYAFSKNFGDSPFDLYKTFYELETLNLLTFPPEVRNMILNAPQWLNISDELPKTDPSNLIFRIEKVKILKEDTKGPIFYKGLSDGEHQFLQILGLVMMVEEKGCLFLLDEPDTHYNPVWRSRLIDTLNKICKLNNKENDDKSRSQEVFITSHSPFVLSDIKGRDVYVFEKINNRVVFKPSPIETYGASAGFILESIFDKEETISKKAKAEIDSLREGINTIEDIQRAADKLNTDFGESIEKFDMFNFLNKKKREFESNQ